MSRRTSFITFGTRPEAIKMAPLALELRRRAVFDVVACLIGQHREMLDQETFSLPVDHDLRIMREGQSLGHITSAVLKGIDPLLDAARPDMVVVHGDTNDHLLRRRCRLLPHDSRGARGGGAADP